MKTTSKLKYRGFLRLIDNMGNGTDLVKSNLVAMVRKGEPSVRPRSLIAGTGAPLKPDTGKP